VKEYWKVADIVNLQAKIVKTYRTSLNSFRNDRRLTSGEVQYVYQVLTNLMDQFTNDIEDVTNVLTDGRLEMNDKERFDRIDQIHYKVSEKYKSISSFTNQVKVLCTQREHEYQELENIKKLYKP
jgi:hypothetical protein